jgi:hypothetical protein
MRRASFAQQKGNILRNYKIPGKYLFPVLFSVAAASQAQAGFWDRKGVCAVFEKVALEVRTRKIAQSRCVQSQASGTGYYEQTFIWADGMEFWIAAENLSGTDYLEFRGKDGPAFYSEQELYDFKSCYITPHDRALLFHCFRADED